MASCLKRKQPDGQRADMISALEPYGLPGGIFSLYSPESSSKHDARKKRVSCHGSPIVTHLFDGHFWRKYGQKEIKGACYPRLYFRCSYREDRHCMAAKQVQRLNKHDPPLYEVTYMYEHTCNAEPVPAPDVVAAARAAPVPSDADGLVLNFGSSGSSHQLQCAAQKQQQPQQYHQWQSVPLNQSLMMNFDSWNGQLQEEPAFFPPDFPPAATSWSPSYSTDESLPSTSNSEDSLLSTWDWESFSGLIDQLDDDAQFPGSTLSWQTDGCSLAHLGMGIEVEEVIF